MKQAARGLGRGLSALIQDAPTPEEGAPVDDAARVARVPIERIRQSPWQPRTAFDEEALEDLARSIRERGVVQPLLLRRVGEDFELIAGERRWRAAQRAGLTELPALIMDVEDRDALELALVENLQREDLNPIEEADGYRLLMERFRMTQDEVAQRVGKARASVANAVRLLSLSDKTRAWVASGDLSAGHAKVLLGLAIPQEQEALAARCVRERLSVRALERILARLKTPRVKKPTSTKIDIPPNHVEQISESVRQRLGSPVRITPSRTRANGRKIKGCIEIDFFSNDDLDRLLVLLGVSDSL